MIYLKQFFYILLISFIGEVLKYFLPLPVPASIYGLMVLFICLETGVIKLDTIRDCAKFLIEIMPLMFIPAGVGLLNSWGILKPVFVPVTVITAVSTVVVMVVSGRVTQAVIRQQKKAGKKERQVN